MIIDPQRIAAGSMHRPRPSRRRVFRPSAMGVVLHELAHILNLGPDDSNPPAGLILAGRRLLAIELSGLGVPTNGPGAAVPWRWHEWGFIRTVLHLRYRAELLGVKLSPTDVFIASDYELSSTWRYLSALDDEPARLTDHDFARISAISPPSRRLRLDVAVGMRQQRRRSGSAIAGSCSGRGTSRSSGCRRGSGTRSRRASWRGSDAAAPD